jgi:Fe-S cluster assembly protein SufD
MNNTEFQKIKSKLPGCDTPWMNDLRVEAMAEFERKGLPVFSDEQWKYTRTTIFEKQLFEAAINKNTQLSPELPSHNSHRLVFIDGCYAQHLSRLLPTFPKNVMLNSLANVLKENPEQIKPYLSKIADYREQAFDALNTAFMNDGVYLNIPAGTIVSEPIEFLFLTSEANENKASYLRNLIIMNEHSFATIIERYQTIGGITYFTSALTEIDLGECVQLEHYKLQQESEQAVHIATTVTRQAKSSRWVNHAVSLGGALVRNDITTELIAENTECELNGLYMVNNKQHVDYHTLIDHIKPKGTSRQTYKGIVNGRGRAVFNGKIVVHPDAQKTDAQMTNKNLLLSKTAEIDTKPELQIDADDVKCSHGTTVGQLSDESLFYLRSRGIDQASARHILTYAFAREMIDKMKLDFVREDIQAALGVSFV